MEAFLDSERRQERLFNRKGVVMNIQRANRTSVMHIILMSRRNILCIMFKIVAVFMITLLAWLYVMVGILLAGEKHLHNRIISLKGDLGP